MAKPASSHPETGETKPNFHITPEQKAQLDWLRSEIGVPNTTEAIRSCINVMVALKRQLQPGSQLFLHTPQGQVRLLIPELEPLPTETWQYLVERPHPWRRQLYIKGRKLLASTVWQDTIANQMSPEEAAENWELPIPAIHEVFRYCETHQELLAMEASEERCRLEEQGVSLEPKIVG
ncbi:hypothetical protein [[Phormidium] sp. ETS-05]|uniref:hypothetical protein n=1 Tax=[Phormidium] sp. ETS-05 TaxID=222819 RepID=UPI0018EF21FD|nr:hypothetical protein [[Phormidium] sp. ETS-05]